MESFCSLSKCLDIENNKKKNLPVLFNRTKSVQLYMSDRSQSAIKL